MTTQDKNIFIISHGYKDGEMVGGPPQDIRDCYFSKNQATTVYYLIHPFPYADYHRSKLFVYKNKKKIKSYSSWIIIGNEPLQYIQHAFINMLFFIFYIKQVDICFALDNLDMLSIYFFRKLNKIKQLIYYSIDFTPKRFNNFFLNQLYLLADKLACILSDIIWVVSKKMITARYSQYKTRFVSRSKFIETEIGFRSDQISIISKPFFTNKYRLVFAGYLMEKQGVQLVIKALPTIIKKYPKTTFTIIGQGEYKPVLEKLVNKLKLSRYVKFLGFIENLEDLHKIITNSGIGFATYKPIPENFSFYADPAKIKMYLGCGLPIITTSVPSIAYLITKKKAGKVVSYSIPDLIKGLEAIFENYRQYQSSAYRLGLNFDSFSIINRSLAKTDNYLKI